MAEAAELSADAITVDLHCHPNLSSGRRLAEFDADVPDNMRAGGLDAGIFAVRGDHGTLSRSPTGHYTESRKPAIGELFQGSQDQLDKVLKACKAGKISLATSPTDILEAKENRRPCAVLAIEGSDPLEADLSRVRFFYDLGVRVLQLMHYRINEVGDIMTEAPRHKGLTTFGQDVVKEARYADRCGARLARHDQRRSFGEPAPGDLLPYRRLYPEIQFAPSRECRHDGDQ